MANRNGEPLINGAKKSQPHDIGWDQDPDEGDQDGLSDDERPHAPESFTERRRAQNELFESWLISNQSLEMREPETNRKDTIEAEDEVLSTHSLIAKHGSRIIKNPREYQLELFERARRENTIAVLDTGSGKTLIAVLLLQWIIDQELERRAKQEEPRISFFLATSVTLVYQQFAVLEQNIDHNVARVCGADSFDNWNKNKWIKLFLENKVIVATADVLHQCLAHGFISMRQINLLIFDEAHNAKKNHAYARIIKDFYITDEHEAARPRIFGMTASPIDARTNAVQAANDLETLLHCRIATTNDTSFFDTVKRPIEQVMRYPPIPQKPFETTLLKSIKAHCPNVTVFESKFENSKEVARQLGRWCADLYLVDALSEHKLHRYELKAERKCCNGPVASQNGDGMSLLNEMQSNIRRTINFVQAEQSKYIAIGKDDFSTKVLELRNYLLATFERPTSHRCIVFVEVRHTARLLALAFMRIGTPHLRPGFLVGINSPDAAGDNSSFRSQVLTLTKFRKGEINCLFATSVAEEGLDVPDCNLIIRFDMYKTMIQYVQSRGRARKENSKFIHMIENGNSLHTSLLSEVRYQEMTMRRFCQALPKDRMLEGNEDHLEKIMAKEKTLRIHNEPSTGAKLTYGNALIYLANFVSAIPTETNQTMHPTYAVACKGTQFIAEVLLPGNAPIRSAIGRICTRRALAKSSAAFEACIKLREKQYLNEHLMPVYQKKLPALKKALLAVNMDKVNNYPMRTKPKAWDHARGRLPEELFVTIVDFPDGLDRPHQPLALLTRTKMLEEFSDFPVYLNDGRATMVRSRLLERSLRVDASLDLLTTFTFRVFQDVFSKKYEKEAAQLSYWLAPVLRPVDGRINGMLGRLSLSVDPEEIIDWQLLAEVSVQEEYRWTPDMGTEWLVNRFIVDKWDGSRKYYSKAVCPEMKPLDPVPKEAVKAKWMANILDYSNSMFRSTREKYKDTWNLQQPVIEAEKELQRRNMLTMPYSDETNVKRKAWICPEPLRISVLPPAVAASCFVWPAIIYRFESYLIALEACELVGLDCGPVTALAAITKDTEKTGDSEGDERTTFKRGMGDNYERLEFIGDTFLKAATSLSTFIQNPNDPEFDLHVKRMHMLCNRNLYNVAMELELYQYIRTIAFSRRDWYPEGLKLLEGKGAGKQGDISPTKHKLGEKTIADVSEALIGAAYMSHNKPGGRWDPSHWKNAIQVVTKLVKNPNHTMQTWNDYITAYAKPTYQTGEVSASQRDLAAKVEREHAYHFKYPRLLRSAFIHPSQPAIYENVPNYQRLEFLGDAILDMASIAHLFYRFPEKDPQWLTEHKMAMVSNKFLGAVCVEIGFHRHLRHSSADLQHLISAYTSELLEAKRAAAGGRDYWTTVSDPPKCLADMVEAFVGALFIDSNFDYNEVQRFFDEHIKWYFEDITLYDTFANNHPCTHLHNMLQTTFACQDYRIMAKDVPRVDSPDATDVIAAVMIHDDIVAYSKGKSGRYARLRAAHKAVEIVEGLAPFEFRSRFKCDCHLKRKPDGENTETPAAKAVADCSV